MRNIYSFASLSDFEYHGVEVSYTGGGHTGRSEEVRYAGPPWSLERNSCKYLNLKRKNSDLEKSRKAIKVLKRS